MNEDTIHDIYYVEHKWNPHFFYLPKIILSDLEKMAPIYTLTCSMPCIRKSLIIFVLYGKRFFPLEKLCNNGTTIIHQLITPSPVLLLPGVSISAVN